MAANATSKTALFANKLPGGALVITDQSFTTGNRFFVHSGTGTNSLGHGRNPESPFASIAYAFDSGLLTANNGDIVYVMPGHAETVSAAAGIDADTAGVTVKGIGSGTSQPKITFDTIITADLDVGAANITFENIHFSANFADLTAPIDVNSTDCTIRNCRFTETAVNMNAVIWILGGSTTTSSRLTVEGCHVIDKDAANTHFIHMAGTDDGTIIRNNVMIGDWGTAAIASTGSVTNITVSHNLIQNAATDADSGIKLAASSTGVVAYNSIGIALAGDATTGVSCGSGVALIQNFVVDTGDRQGVLDPAGT
jgi:hypothetical protein